MYIYGSRFHYFHREMETKNRKHFVLVHGASHGAWCWYKLVPLLKLAGHVVTTLDLSASGINPKQVDELQSIHDYVQPLMQFLASLPQYERVVLVGHSYGGFGISLAMENFPEKILSGIFISAYMPNCVDPPATLVQEFFKRVKGGPTFDSQIEFGGEDQGNLPISLSFRPIYLEKIMYQYCPPEDLELAKMVLRPFKFLLQDLTTPESVLTESKYGSVNRFYVVCKGDAVVSEEYQLWSVENNSPKAVKFIDEAGHMPMFSKPKALALCLEAFAEMC